MKSIQITLFLAISSLVFFVSSGEFISSVSAEKMSNISKDAPGFTKGPESAQDSMWQYIVNNAIRAADEYATERNPNSVFIGQNLQIDFAQQHAGEYEGRHLLKIVNKHDANTSFAMLLPLFDEYASSEDLDDEGQLWQVVVVKFNGKDF